MVELREATPAELIEECRRRGWRVSLFTIADVEIPDPLLKRPLKHLTVGEFHSLLRDRFDVMLRIGRTSYPILEILLRRYPNPVPLDVIAYHVYQEREGPAWEQSTVRVTISQLRKRLRNTPFTISCVKEHGYCLVDKRKKRRRAEARLECASQH